MVLVWAVKMRVTLCLLLTAVFVLADKNGNRRTKPFIADAVGNTLPPPSNVPATVGSPISLLTPDKYEFYTFDESGELVKRLMTLEEIQAIVAAGEDSEGLVTFANDNQPTIAFNFSQPPYTKVHSVVTNVQNVLKAQMEAQKNKPLLQPTLDTPDVSDSWSLILPSIFGNSGVDIVPDKAGSSFTPETETLEDNLNADDGDNSLSKEGSVKIQSSTPAEDNVHDVKTTSAAPIKSSSTTTTTTTAKPTTTRKITTTAKPITTTRKKFLTTARPRTTTTKIPTTTKPTTTTTKLPPTTRPTTTTTKVPSTTTTTTTSTTTTVKPVTTTTTTSKPTSAPKTTQKRLTTTKKPALTTTTKEYISNDIPTAKPIPEFEKISTFIPVSTVKYLTERTTHKPIDATKAPFVYAITTKRSPSTVTKSPQLLSSTQAPKSQTTVKATTEKAYVTAAVEDHELERINLTTITTQSVSPSTTVSSTEFISLEQSKPDSEESEIKYDDPVLPIFDVAQSISQIASDLGSNYQPLPTASNLLETTKLNGIDNMESKENLDMDIPSDDNDKDKNKNDDNFVKISTIDPHPPQINKIPINETKEESSKDDRHQTTTETISTTETTTDIELTTIVADITAMDPILTESMGDLLSQVVHEAPQSISETNEMENDNNISTTEKVFDTTTDISTDIPAEVTTAKDIVISTTQKNTAVSEKEPPVETTEKLMPLEKEFTKISAANDNKINTENKLKDDENAKDFVKISVSTNSSNNESKAQNNEPVVISAEKQAVSNKETVSQKEETMNKNNKDTITEEKPNKTTNLKEEVTTSSKVDITIKPSIITNDLPNENVTALQSNIDKEAVENEPINNNKKNKIPEPLPKVDEFKKKIQKINDEELANDRNDPWKLIPTVTPPKGNDISKEKIKPETTFNSLNDDDKDVVLEFSKENQGLEVTTKDLGDDVAQFAELCNELAFRYWNTMVENIDKKRSFVLSPYSITSMLAMIFMGARGATSGEMNEILKLDDMVTFNPHFTLKNISDSIESATNSGIVVSAFVRELFSDRNRGKILTFYKERAQHFYSGHVEEINFKLVSDIVRRRTNLLVKKHTWGKIPEYMKTNSIVMKPPLAAFSTNIFQTDCTGTSVDGRDGEMYFVVSPNVRQRRLVPVPAVVYKSGFLAGYDPVLDATAAALGNTNSIVSTMFIMPGQQGNIVHADDLEKLEQRLLENNPTTPAWNRVLRTLLPRVGLELQIPRFSHKSVFNVSSTLREMGLKDLFDADHADLGGLIGPSKDLFLSDMIQVTSFVTCGENMIGEQHHIEEYPDTVGTARRRTSRWADWDEPRDYQRAFHDPHDVGEAMHLPLHLRPRQARLPTRSVQPARLKFDRPFLFFVRHNPSGMILYVGRYNPRLLP